MKRVWESMPLSSMGPTCVCVGAAGLTLPPMVFAIYKKNGEKMTHTRWENIVGRWPRKSGFCCEYRKTFILGRGLNKG